MYHHVRGQLVRKVQGKDRCEAIVDAGGVGYRMRVPMSTFFALPAIDQDVMLLSHLAVREDDMVLYGFATEEERRLFELLITVNGVGPQNALSVLSGLPMADCVGAIQSGSSGLLKKIKGIGDKTAKRITLELKDKVADFNIAPAPVAAADPGSDLPEEGIIADASLALQTLGLTASDADRRVAAVVKRLGESTVQGMKPNDVVKEALRA